MNRLPYELMGKYFDAVNANNGELAATLRRQNATNVEFVAFADRIDRLKQRLSTKTHETGRVGSDGHKVLAGV